MAVECPSLHDIVGRRQDEVWNTDAIPNVGRFKTAESDEKGIRSTLKEIVARITTRKAEGMIPGIVSKAVML